MFESLTPTNVFLSALSILIFYVIFAPINTYVVPKFDGSKRETVFLVSIVISQSISFFIIWVLLKCI